MTTRRIVRFIAELVRRILLVVLLASFALVVTGTLLVNILSNTLLDTGAWHRLIDETQLAARSRTLVADFLVTYSLKASQSTTFLENYPLNTWEGVAEVLLPTEWVQQNLYTVVDTTIGWMKGEQSGLPDFTLDLSPVLSSLQGDQGALAILPLLQNIPACPADSSDAQVMVGDLMSCLPGNKDLTGYASVISSLIAKTLPAEISLSNLESMHLVSSQTYQSLEKVRSAVRGTQSLVQLGLRLSLLLLSLYALLNSPAPRRVFRTLAWPLYAAGGLSLVMLIGWQLFSDLGLGLAITGLFPGTKLEEQALLADMLRFISGSIVRDWLVWIAALIGLAVLIQVLTFVVTKAIQVLKDRRKVEEPAQGPTRLRKQFR
jgi:hypothetical protein